eukprot:1143694-Pelagomonas_calceolata.AAC.2
MYKGVSIRDAQAKAPSSQHGAHLNPSKCAWKQNGCSWPSSPTLDTKQLTLPLWAGEAVSLLTCLRFSLSLLSSLASQTSLPLHPPLFFPPLSSTLYLPVKWVFAHAGGQLYQIFMHGLYERIMLKVQRFEFIVEAHLADDVQRCPVGGNSKSTSLFEMRFHRNMQKLTVGDSKSAWVTDGGSESIQMLLTLNKRI